MGRESNSFLPRFSVNRPITVLMGLTAMLVVGFIAFTQIPVELFPSGFTPKFLGVWTPYPNANPQEVEEQIAKPLEEQIRTISGMRRVETNSFTNGCWTFIEFAKGTDMDVAYAQLRDRVDRVKAELPDDVERLYIRKWSNDDEPIMWVSFAQQKPIEDVYTLAEMQIQKPLERIDGVAKVEIWGAEEKSVLIHVNQNKVKAFKINLYQVIQTLRSDNFAISSGRVVEGGRDIFVRSMGKFLDLEEIRNLPVKGTNILLKDVAEVKYDVPERTWRNRIDGQNAIGIGVFKESTANTVDLCDRVEKKFTEEFAKNPLLADFKIQILFNQGDWINESVDNLERTAMWGGIFAFLVLFFFLRRIRMTIIVNVAIPLSLLVTLIFMYFIGWTLNLITMMGLMISIGMVVDNSIVVVENIYRWRAEGLSNRDAAISGTSEVGLAITMATLTTVVVFLPLILMNGDEDFTFFMLRIGMPVVIALLSSLAVAMIFIPLGATRISSAREVKEARILVWTNELYRKALRWTMQHRVESFILLLLTIFSMQFASQNAKYNNDSEGNINDIRIFFDMPSNYSLKDAERVFDALEDSVRTKKELYGIRTVNSRYRANWGQMRIFLVPPPKKDWYEVVYDNILKQFGVLPDGIMERDAVVEDIKKRFPEFPGVEMRTSWRRSGAEDASVSIMLYGDDTSTLTDLSKEVERRLNSIDEIVSVETDQERGNDEIHLYLKRDQLKKYGIAPNVISGTIQYALRGLPLPKYHTPDKEIDVQIQVREEDRKNLSQLKNLTFFTASGKEIPLDAVASFHITKGLGEIHRENGKTYLQVKANTTKDDMKDIFRKVDFAMAGFEMPYGYSWSKGRNFDRMNESNDSVKFAMFLAVTFVFIIMGILFESFVLPLSVIFSMPFALVGAFWMMYLTKTPIDFMSQIGFVILVGIVVNNAIVLIDLINRLRNEGYSRFDAIIEAGRLRYRPILMTAFTTIGGLIPMAVGNTAMIGIPYAPMGRTIIGGLLLSTVVSLIAVPWAYTVFDDMRNYFRRLATMYLQKSDKVVQES
ncbi:MAG: efflux RND transporter permease subunit [Deferribacteres bacterium]|nr:efflux RND transporter permease subunit [candidate division KSB1 bacterium]MCB9500741.1 efflux RND transporter permease subunit [Deferribacteres bacterium]